MIFGALAAWQAWLVIAAAVAAAVGVFFLRLKAPTVIVPSLALWRRVIDERRERTLWERIRKAVSLAVVVLITAAVAMAVLRPERAARGAARTSAAAGRMAIVLDASPSMRATMASSSETRWARAVARARALAQAAGGDEVVLATTADGVVEGPTADVSLIEAALDRIDGTGPSGADTAVALAGASFGAGSTYLLTDGAVARPIAADVTVESVFEAANNIAITAFDVQAATGPGSPAQAFVTIANYGTAPADVHLVVSQGSASALDAHVALAAGAALDRVIPLGPSRGADAARVRARVSVDEPSADALAADDEAVAWLPAAEPIAVTVVSNQPQIYGPFLSENPALAPTFVTPQAYKPGAERVAIFDEAIPATASPAIPALVVAPPVTTDENPLAVRGVPIEAPRGAAAPEWQLGPVHPLVAGVDLLTLPLDRAHPFDGPALETIAASTAGAPLIAVRETPDRRAVVFGFSVNASKMMFAPGFPALLSNTIAWLAHPVPPGVRHPGVVVLPASATSVTAPDGQTLPLVRATGATRAVLVRSGFYAVAGGGATSVLAVNAGSPEISDLRRTRLPDAVAVDDAHAVSRGRPWWIIAAGVALALALGEWVTWQRRVTV